MAEEPFEALVPADGSPGQPPELPGSPREPTDPPPALVIQVEQDLPSGEALPCQERPSFESHHGRKVVLPELRDRSCADTVEPRVPMFSMASTSSDQNWAPATVSVDESSAASTSGGQALVAEASTQTTAEPGADEESGVVQDHAALVGLVAKELKGHIEAVLRESLAAMEARHPQPSRRAEASSHAGRVQHQKDGMTSPRTPTPDRSLDLATPDRTVTDGTGTSTSGMAASGVARTQTRSRTTSVVDRMSSVATGRPEQRTRTMCALEEFCREWTTAPPRRVDSDLPSYTGQATGSEMDDGYLMNSEISWGLPQVVHQEVRKSSSCDSQSNCHRMCSQGDSERGGSSCPVSRLEHTASKLPHLQVNRSAGSSGRKRASRGSVGSILSKSPSHFYGVKELGNEVANQVLLLRPSGEQMEKAFQCDNEALPEESQESVEDEAFTPVEEDGKASTPRHQRDRPVSASHSLKAVRNTRAKELADIAGRESGYKSPVEIWALQAFRGLTGTFPLRLCSIMPWDLGTKSGFLMRPSIWYQWVVFSIAVAIMVHEAVHLVEIYRSGGENTERGCNAYLSQFLLAASVVAGLVMLGTPLGCRALCQCNTEVLVYLERENFLDSWKRAMRIEELRSGMFWLAATAAKAYSAQPGPQRPLEIAQFAFVSAMLCALVHCCFHVCNALAGLLDLYGHSLVTHERALNQAIQGWNVQEALLRRASGSVEGCFFALQAMATAFVLIGSFEFAFVHTSIACVIPGLILALNTVRAFFSAAQVTSKCERMPALINFCSFGEDMEQQRERVVTYMSHSAAGFHVFEVRITVGLVMKLIYLCVAVVFTVTTRVVF